MKTLNLDLTVATSKPTYGGGVELELIGRTVNNVSHKVVFVLPPSTVGYLGHRLYTGLQALRAQIDEAIAECKGETP